MKKRVSVETQRPFRRGNVYDANVLTVDSTSVIGITVSALSALVDEKVLTSVKSLTPGRFARAGS